MLSFFVLKGCASVDILSRGARQIEKTYVRSIDDRRGQYMRLRLMQKIDAEETDCYQYFLQSILVLMTGACTFREGLAVRTV